MSFSQEVKAELAKRVTSAKHCQLAELAAIMNLCGQYGFDADGNVTIGFQTENEACVKKGFTLLKKTFNIDSGSVIKKDDLYKIIDKIGDLNGPAKEELYERTCCKRAFLRGAFLGVGSMSDPEKSYHLEFNCDVKAKAEQLQQLMKTFEIDSKIILRKKNYVVYIKEGSCIVDLLNVCEAPIALMSMENSRILKEMRNSVNRRVNCETANIAKTVGAAARQISDIRLLKERYGFQNLPMPLREMAQIRLDHPDAPLKELGDYFDPPIGKSGVNHRLRKLSELAESIKLQ
ncbi:MAG: DNA-binding protein WhiA [Lachnospiraceae bacterium]|nr:DNA-binding protein WhiA [Lachnospiraceae bacterium]